jgi:hypothetical protein
MMKSKTGSTKHKNTRIPTKLLTHNGLYYHYNDLALKRFLFSAYSLGGSIGPMRLFPAYRQAASVVCASLPHKCIAIAQTDYQERVEMKANWKPRRQHHVIMQTPSMIHHSIEKFHRLIF